MFLPRKAHTLQSMSQYEQCLKLLATDHVLVLPSVVIILSCLERNRTSQLVSQCLQVLSKVLLAYKSHLKHPVKSLLLVALLVERHLDLDLTNNTKLGRCGSYRVSVGYLRGFLRRIYTLPSFGFCFILPFVASQISSKLYVTTQTSLI